MREDDLLGLEFWRKQRAMGVRGVTTAAKGGKGGSSWSSYWTPQYLIDNFGASNILAYWKLNEETGTTAVDSINGINATYTAGCTLGQPGVTDALGKSALIDSTDGNINLYSTALKNGVNKSEGGVVMWVKMAAAKWSDGAVKWFISIGDSERISIYKDTANLLIGIYYADTILKTMTTYVSNMSGWVQLGLSWSKANDRVRLFINGIPVRVTETTGLGVWDQAIASYGAVIGAQYNIHYLTDAYVSNVILLKAEPTLEQMRLSYFPFKEIVFDGDSRMAASFTPYCIADSLTERKSRNLAVSGKSISSLITDAPTKVDPYYRSGSILVIWAGVNDLGVDAATKYAQLATYCTARKAAGFKVIVCTEIDSQDAAHNAVDWHGTVYPALNALLRADHSFADALCDLGAQAELQDATNATYFNADKVHLVAAGMEVVKNTMLATIQTLV